MTRANDAALRSALALLLSGGVAPAQLVAGSGAAATTPPQVPVEVVVTQTRARPSPNGTTIGAREGARTAGTQGDAVKALQSLPGVARAGPGAGEIIAWGSAPNETRIYIDGVELPVLYHGSGIRSVVPSEWLASLTLVPGGFGAEHGRGLGGIVTLTTRELEPRAAALQVNADLLDAGAVVTVPLTDEMSVAAAGRVGYADQWLPRLTNEDVGSLMTVPSYQDWQLLGSFRPGPNQRLNAVALGSRDAWERVVPSSDRSHRVTERETLVFQRFYLNYVSELGGGRTELTPFVGFDDRSRSSTIGTSGFGLETRTLQYGLRGAQSLRFGQFMALRVGVDALGSVTDVEREGTLTLPAREGDPRVFGQAPGIDVAHDHFMTHVLDVAPYAEADLSWGRLTLTPGLRADTYLLETDRLRPAIGRVPAVGNSRATLVFEPRFALRYDLEDVARFSAAAGLYHQAPSAEDSSAVFGNPELGLARGIHLSLGERVALTPSASLEVLGYWKRTSALPARSPLPTPNTAEAVLPEGEGRSYGAQFLVRQTLSQGWSGWLAWTISRSERRDGSGQPLRRFDHDQPHVVSLVVTRRLGRWSVGTRLRYASGSPRTPVVGASYNLQADRYEPIFGPINGERLPAFIQLDLRVDHTLSLGADARLTVYADALNVLLRKNAEDFAFSSDYRERQAVTGLPPMLLVGARFER